MSGRGRIEQSAVARAALRRQLAAHSEPAPGERIFVNRALRMETIRCVGFDLDWTLADYERLPLERLVFELARERLIEHHGYPEHLRGVAFRPDFPCRGLLIDREAGTVLRMSRHRFVNLAYFGRERLDRADLKRLYRFEPIQPASSRFYHIDSLFELPETNLYAELIELSKHGGDLARRSFRRIFTDVRSAVDWVHAARALKARVEADTPTFLRRDPLLALALLRLRLGGRKIFLLTNSGWRYASHLCAYLFDGAVPGLDSWRQLFDLVVVSAGKPTFFRRRRPFVELDDSGGETGETEHPVWGRVYRGGCLPGLMRLIDAPGEQVLYVGDHVYGDVVSSKRESTWRTALVVRELETELASAAQDGETMAAHLRLLRRLNAAGGRMDHLRDLDALDAAGASDGGRAATETRADLERAVEEHRDLAARVAGSADEIDRSYNRYWGSLFKQGTSKSRFADQIESYACLYTSRVRNFVRYGSRHYFRVAHDPMMHELADLDPETGGEDPA